ncbi:MAG TPA: hypothetical protein VGM88_09620 [Kofleriaceae bacterium]|jgi:hypothetical protein
MSACTRCASPIEHGDLRCSICALAVPDAAGAAASSHAKVLRCPDCGAAIAFNAEAQAPRCGFCGATMAVEQPIDPVEAAQLRVPFSVDRGAAERAMRTWLGKRGYFAPAALASDAVIDSLTPLAWAAWLVNANAEIAWAADSDADSHRSSWAPHSGSVSLDFANLLVPASRGLSTTECRQLASSYDLSTVVGVSQPRAPDEVESTIEAFDAQRSAARRLVHESIESLARVRVEPTIPGGRKRNVKVACLLQRQTNDRVALPAWVLAYRYRGAPYRAIVHGQRGDLVIGNSPTDWAKVARVVVTGALVLFAIVAAISLLAGCGGDSHTPIDAPDYGETCAPTPPTFAPLTGRVAVQGTLNVHVDAGGLIEVDTTSDMLLDIDLVQTGTQITMTATVCKIQIPDVPLAGQDMPIQFQIPQATIDSVGQVTGMATLDTADQTCTNFQSAPITLILGARIDPSVAATATLPAADDDGNFQGCAPTPETQCALAIGTGCACDQEGDSTPTEPRPGATLIAHNVPAIMLDEVYVTLRTTFSLTGQVWSTDLVKGTVDASLDTGILACRLADGTACTSDSLHTVKALNPIVTQQPGNPSTFRTARIADTATCADIIAMEATLFPR